MPTDPYDYDDDEMPTDDALERSRYRASFPPGEASHREWEAAFRELCQNDDGAPLAKLLRSVALAPDEGRCLIPSAVLGDLAQLLDPSLFWSRFSKAQDRRAMRLKATPLIDVERDRLKRDETIWAEVLALIQQGESVSEAARKVGDRHGLKERQVTEIWSDARKQQGMLQQVGKRKKSRCRNTATK
jgi:hypothetical protein